MKSYSAFFSASFSEVSSGEEPSVLLQAFNLEIWSSMSTFEGGLEASAHDVEECAPIVKLQAFNLAI